MSKHRPARMALLLMSCFAILALAYSIWLPLWEAPDEVAHFQYITDLVSSGYRLPRQQLGALSEAHQPPLYYALAAPLVGLADLDDPSVQLRLNPMFPWASPGGNDPNIALHGTAETFPYRGQALGLRLARFLSIALATLSVGFSFAIALLAFPQRPVLAAAAAGLMAFCPQFLFISGAVNNDSLLTLAAIASIWQTLRILRAPDRPRLWFGLGAWLGIAILAKPHGFAISAACALALAWYLRGSLKWKQFAQMACTAVAPVLGITLWWFARNQVLYGDPLGMRVYESIYWMNLRYSPLDPRALQDMVSVQFQSFWATFGWTTVRGPDWFYLLVGLVHVGAVAGLVIDWRRGHHQELSGRRRRVLGVLGLALVVQYAFVLCTITQCNESCYQGRYLFPALSALAVWLTVGLAGPDGSRPWLAVTATTALLAAATYLGAGVLRPAFDPVPEPKWRLWLMPGQTDVVYGDLFRLRSYSIELADPPTHVSVTLYWEAVGKLEFDYSVFTHVLDGEGRRIGQADQLPGLDRNYPPTLWLPGDVVRDRHVIDLDPSADPAECVLWIGVYDWSTGERLRAEAGPGFTLREDALLVPLAPR